MGNYVRLTADAQPPSEYLKSFLISHVQWKEFVPLLRYVPARASLVVCTQHQHRIAMSSWLTHLAKTTDRDDTIKQFVTAFPAPSGGHPISLSPFASAETFGLYSSMAPPKPITEDDIDVDLGSECTQLPVHYPPFFVSQPFRVARTDLRFFFWVGNDRRQQPGPGGRFRVC
jgi:hypothetical protein